MIFSNYSLKYFFKFSNLLLILFSIISCAVPENEFTIKNHKKNNSLIFIYRPNSPSIVGIAEIPFVYLDDQKVGRLCKGCYFKITAQPGHHTVKIRASFLTAIPFYELGKLDITTLGEEEIFVRYIANVDQAHKFGPQPPITTFLRVPIDIGQQEIQKASEIKSGGD